MRARLVALLAAVVLGAGGGVATAVLTDDASAPTYADPLGLRIPKVDLACTGDPVLVVGFGDNAAALRNEVVNAPDEELRYLDTRRSCRTRWTPANSTADPTWVVYRAGDPTELCLDRLSNPVHRRDNVTFLVDGIQERAMCLCEVPGAAGPELKRDNTDTYDEKHVVWISELQDMLITIDAELRPDAPVRLTDQNRVPGRYGRVMAARISVAQKDARLAVTGVVDEATWNQVTALGCRLYDYR